MCLKSRVKTPWCFFLFKEFALILAIYEKYLIFSTDGYGKTRLLSQKLKNFKLKIPAFFLTRGRAMQIVVLIPRNNQYKGNILKTLC